MSKNNHLRGLNKQLRERNPVINTLLKDFNDDMDDDDMVIENAVYGTDDIDINNIAGSFESSYGDEFENEKYLDFDDLMEDEDDEPIDDGVDSDLGEDEDDEEDFEDNEDDEGDDNMDLEDVMEAASIFDDIDDHFNPESDLDEFSLDLLDDEL